MNPTSQDIPVRISYGLRRVLLSIALLFVAAWLRFSIPALRMSNELFAWVLLAVFGIAVWILESLETRLPDSSIESRPHFSFPETLRFALPVSAKANAAEEYAAQLKDLNDKADQIRQTLRAEGQDVAIQRAVQEVSARLDRIEHAVEGQRLLSQSILAALEKESPESTEDNPQRRASPVIWISVDGPSDVVTRRLDALRYVRSGQEGALPRNLLLSARAGHELSYLIQRDLEAHHVDVGVAWQWTCLLMCNAILGARDYREFVGKLEHIRAIQPQAGAFNYMIGQDEPWPPSEGTPPSRGSEMIVRCLTELFPHEPAEVTNRFANLFVRALWTLEHYR